MNLKAEDVTKTSCTLTWNPPENDGGSPVTGYYVEKHTGAKWMKVNRKPVKDRSLVIDDLVEGSDCEYRVCAENDAGVGKSSDSTGRFKAKDPYSVPGRPDAPEVTEITPESATLTWKAPAKDGGSPVTNYIVEMKSKTDVKWGKVKRPAGVDTTMVVEGLMEGMEYEFRVSAENKAGASQPSKSSAPAKYGEPYSNIIILYHNNFQSRCFS